MSEKNTIESTDKQENKNEIRLESTDKQIKKDDKLYVMIGKLFGYTDESAAYQYRKKFSKNNSERLAKMANIPLNIYHSDTGKYNLIIRDRILKNDIIPVHGAEENTAVLKDYQEIMNAYKDNPEKQKKFEGYVGNMSISQGQRLNILTTQQKIIFFDQQLDKVESTKKDMNQKMSQEYGMAADNSTDQLAIMKELDTLTDSITAFARDNKIEIDYKIIETSYQEYKKTSAFKGIKEGNKSEEEIEEAFKLGQIQKQIIASDKYIKLSDTEKTKFESKVTRYYVVTQKLDIDLEAMGLEIIADKAHEYLSKKYNNDTQELTHTIRENIISDKDMKDFLDDEDQKIQELGPEKDKDKNYYLKLLQFYPEMNSIPGKTKPMSEYLSNSNDNMTIKDSMSESEKKGTKDVLVYLKKNAKGYEKKMIRKTNEIVQEHAVASCLESLQYFMDIDLDEKENLLQQLSVLSDTDAISRSEGKLLLTIHGVRAGKKMTLSYDLISGNVYYHPFLFKGSINESDPIVTGNTKEHEPRPLTSLASISQTLEGAKQMEFQELIKTSENIQGYGKNIRQKMDRQQMVGKGIGYSVGQDMLKKRVIQDEITQDVMKCSGRDSGQDSLITKEYAAIHGLYTYLSRSFGYYVTKSIDQMLLWKTTMKRLLTYREDQSKRLSSDKFMESKDKNPERFVVQTITDRTIIPQMTANFSDQGPEELLASLFKCFEMQEGGRGIIDSEKMNDFLDAAEGTNRTDNKVGKRERNAAFTKLVHDLETRISTHQADKNLESQLQKA